MLEHAVRAASMGLYVFPVEPGEKLPALLEPGQPWRIKWGAYATRSLPKVIDYWTTWPDANVGVACKPSNLLVIDCDMPKTGEEMWGSRFEELYDVIRDPMSVDGTEALRLICTRLGQDYDELWQTYTVTTGRGGAHLYFWWPPEIKAQQSSLAPLLDIRCNARETGGYVLAAGSRTASGLYVVENDAPILPAPAWLVELCKERPKQLLKRPSEPFQRPGSANFQGLVDQVRAAQPSNRNHCLYWAACAMAEDGADLEEAIRLLVPAAVYAGLDEYGSTQTVKSAYRTHGR